MGILHRYTMQGCVTMCFCVDNEVTDVVTTSLEALAKVAERESLLRGVRTTAG